MRKDFRTKFSCVWCRKVRYERKLGVGYRECFCPESLAARCDYYPRITPAKHRLYEAGLLKPECSWCGITEWRGQPAPLELDHIDGDGENNRIANLRILCCNCHAQTPTYKVKNSARHKIVAVQLDVGMVL